MAKFSGKKDASVNQAIGDAQNETPLPENRKTLDCPDELAEFEALILAAFEPPHSGYKH